MTPVLARGRAQHHECFFELVACCGMWRRALARHIAARAATHGAAKIPWVWWHPSPLWRSTWLRNRRLGAIAPY